MNGFIRDLAYTARSLRRSRLFVWSTVLSLGLGIGATTTMFSVIDAIDLRPLPFRRPDRIVLIHETAPQGSPWCRGPLGCMGALSAPAITDWQDQSGALDLVGAYLAHPRNLTDGNSLEALRTADVSPELFGVLGISPLIGRTFTATDVRSDDKLVVLGYDLWQTRFGGNRSIIGQHLALSDDQAPGTTAVTVIGVMPRGFSLLSSEAWLPLSPSTMMYPKTRDSRLLLALGRLREGKSVQDADAEARLIAARSAATYPQSNRGWSAGVIPFSAAFQLRLNQLGAAGMTAGQQRFTLFAVVAFVLLVATLNVAGLCVVRARAREQELTIRTALGASRRQLVRIVMSECICIAMLGGALGLVLAVWGARIVSSALYLNATQLPIGVNGHVLAFAFLLSVTCGVIASVLPTLTIARLNIARTLQARVVNGRTARTWTQRGIVALETACALMLLTGAGLLAREFFRLRYVEPGYATEGLYVVDPHLPRTIRQGADEQFAFANNALTHLKAVPGVAAATVFMIVAQTPLPDNSAASLVGPPTGSMAVEPDFFRVTGIRLVRGRAFGDDDRAGGAPVAVVDETAAATYWPEQDAIGKVLLLRDSTGIAQRITVVGIAARAKLSVNSVVQPGTPGIYRPIQQVMNGVSSRRFVGRFYVRRAGSSDIVADLRSTLHQVTGLPTGQTDVEALASALDTKLAPQRFHALILIGFALFGMLLAVFGVYGVTAYVAMRRTREIGLRIALGAEPRSILMLVAGTGLRTALIGVSIGVVGFFMTAGVLRKVLMVTRPTDPWTIAVSVLALTIAAVLAGLIPARRAMSVDVVSALRVD